MVLGSTVAGPNPQAWPPLRQASLKMQSALCVWLIDPSLAWRCTPPSATMAAGDSYESLPSNWRMVSISAVCESMID